MALTAGITPARRGPPPTGSFGGAVAAGEQIWRGGLICWNASGNLQRLQTAGSVSFAGLASKDYNNTAGAAAASVQMEALKGTFALTVPSAVYANINAAVYATDDATLTLTAASNLQVGTLAGIENGQTYVKLLGG